MQNSPIKVLFLCTGNSARSIMAESLLNHHGQGRFEAFSAGSHPVGQVSPFVLETLKEMGIPIEGLRSKSWNEFATARAPDLDVVITVCDNAANETCPIWYSTPVKLHWSFVDPAAATGADMVKRYETRRIFTEIDAQIRKFIALPAESLVPERLEMELRTIAPGK